MTEFIFDAEALVAGELPNGTILAPGALDSQIGKTVPVSIGEGEAKKQVGEAVLFKDGDGVSASIRIFPPDKK